MGLDMEETDSCLLDVDVTWIDERGWTWMNSRGMSVSGFVSRRTFGLR